jgi:hypothetical protein
VVQPDGIRVSGAAQAPVQPQAGAFGGFDATVAPADVSRPVGPRGPSPFVDFLLFRRMIVPILIHLIFWLGVLGSVIISLIMPFALQQQMGVLAFVLIPFILVFALLNWRIICELLFLPFRINETLTDILNQLKRKE